MAIVLDGTTGITTPGLTNTGTSTFEAGTAAAPSIAPTGDPNTGMFFPAADTIAFSEGGVEAVRINSSGNVGVGTSTPTSLNNYKFLTLNASAGAGVSFFIGGSDAAWIYSSSTGLRISDEQNQPIIFNIFGAEKFRIGTAGQFGVGGANYGTASQVLTSNGPSAAPSWQNAASGAQDYIVQSYGIV